ncbi:MAG: YobI family P-loop NTPase, partial [Lutibacter sp.]
YNVVIIEYLDRFEQTEIFTKLREINLLINNSKSINRQVAFIYAVRDEMFKENDRTKFFDFIIPIIPVINYSNSNEQLTKALKEFGYSISTDLIDEVAFYVDDMRLLYNVVNEFHIYFQKFQGKEFQGKEFMDKLFAMIVYKNIYPEDFVKLGRNSGILYKNLVENKEAWVKEAIEEIEKDDMILKKELDQLEKALPKNLDELKRIYLLEYLKKASNLLAFRIGNSNYTTENMLNEENFEKLFNNSVNYNSSLYGNNQPFGFQFSQVEAQIDSEQSYLERKVEIEQKNSGRMLALRDKLKSNQEKIRNTKGAKIKYLLKDKKVSLTPNPSKQEQLITLLIRNGYIAEDYLNYISYFYPGSITENDHWFLMNVRNETPSDFEYKLDEVGNVIKKISDSEFEKNYVLNYNLVDHLFEFRGNGAKKNITIKLLSNESVDSVKFVKSYIEKSKHATIFVKELCKIWTHIWGFIEQDSSLPEVEKLSYYTLILNNAEVGDIKKLASVSGLEFFISSKPDFLTLIVDEEKLIAIIDLFDIKFTSLIFDGISKYIREYVYENNNYALNSSMLMLMIKTFGELNQENFNNSNFAAIQLSKCDSLINYVNNHIAKYIDSVYLKLENNKEEQLNYLVDLLNHAEILKSDKERILLWTNTVIKDISELETSIELIDFLLQNSKAEANWLNISFIYEENEKSFSETLINFLNDPENTKTLSSKIFDSKEINHIAFRRVFILNNDINDEFYSSYIDAFPFNYGDLNFETLSKPKVSALVEKGKLSFNLDSYIKLKTNFSSLHLTLSINNISSFFKEFSVLNLSEQELIELLENSSLAVSNKIKLIGLFETENTITEIKALTLIGNISLEHTALKLSEPTLSSILLKSSIKQNQKIELFMRNISMFKTDFISTFLNSLGGKFKELNEKGPMPSFRKTNNLVIFFDYLKKIGKISKIKDKDDWIKITTFRN